MSHTALGGSCPFCGSDQLKESFFETVVVSGRRRKVVNGLQQTDCVQCGEVYVSESQHDFNARAMEARGKSEQAFVTSGFIRSLRERAGLTQRNASKLFGAGDSAFGKWESGQLPSGPAALLLQSAMHVPGVIQFLASLAQVEVVEHHEGLEWRSDAPSATPAQSRLTLRRIKSPPTSKVSIDDDAWSFDDLYGVAA